MGEDQNQIGDRAEDRLLALLEGLGWQFWGENRDIPCTIRSHQDTDSHGVDGYMTYEDPYSKAQRGVLIESKSRKWSSWNKGTLSDAADQALETVECVPNSDKFQEVFNGANARAVNTAILGAYTNQGNYSREKFSGYTDGLEISKKGRGPFPVLILDNYDLNRLASLHAEFTSLKQRFNDENDAIGFYYPSLSDSISERTHVVAIEYILSDYLFAKLKTSEGSGRERTPRDINMVFTFDDISHESLRFLLQSLYTYQLLDSDEVWVYYYGRDEDGEDLDTRTIVDGFIKNVIPDNAPRFEINQMPRVEYESYVESKRGSQ